MTIHIPESQKIGLDKEEIQKLEAANNHSEAQQNAVNVWLISFYFTGIRIGGVLQLRWLDFADSCLPYRMDKNSKLLSLKIPEKAKKIFAIYRNLDTLNDLIFTYLENTNLRNPKEVSLRTRSVTRNLNRALKRAAKHLNIKKNMSKHIVRHSF